MALAEFEETWGRKYPHVVLSWKRHWPELATFFNYPEAVRRLIYTTNPIESLNSRVRKTVKGKSVFPTEIALFKALYLAVAEAEKRWTMRTRNWQEIMAQLSIFFQERLKPNLSDSSPCRHSNSFLICRNILQIAPSPWRNCRHPTGGAVHVPVQIQKFPSHRCR